VINEALPAQTAQVLPISWEKTIPIRHKVLWPNKEPEFCHVEGDVDALHFGAFYDEEIVCVASIYREGEHARLRKFATLMDHQNKGIGTTMLAFILKTIKEHGVTYFWCDARESAIDFYQKFDLKPEGKIFYKSTIPYYKMSLYL
jgi:GNAT superfamily N-acetyltransferase